MYTTTTACILPRNLQRTTLLTVTQPCTAIIVLFHKLSKEYIIRTGSASGSCVDEWTTNATYMASLPHDSLVSCMPLNIVIVIGISWIKCAKSKRWFTQLHAKWMRDRRSTGHTNFVLAPLRIVCRTIDVALAQLDRSPSIVQHIITE